MSSQRSPRYPLRSHDLPLSSDLFAAHKYPTSPEKPMLDGGSKGIMPSLVDFSKYYSDNSYTEDEPFASAKTLVGWQEIHDPAMLLEDLNSSQMSHSLFEVRPEGAFVASTVGTPVDQNLWDFETLQSPPDITYPSSMCPRAISLRAETITKDLAQSKTCHSLSSEVGEQQHLQSHHTQSPFQRATHDVLALSPREMPFIKSTDNSRSSDFSTQKRVKAENSDIGSPGIFKECSPRTVNDESDADSSVTLEPYAQLIYRALKSVPGHGMVLKDIYDWFEKNTDKAKNTSSKGWQNSIRHNLSMNGAFKKVEQITPSEESKKGYIWVLEQSALEEGVKSTTRYRKVSSNKKISKSEAPAPQRQRSGSRGGKAARKAAKSRRSTTFDEFETLQQYDDRLPVDLRTISTIDDHASTFFSPERVPYYLHTPHPPTAPLMPQNISYTFSDITGCASGPANNPLFYESLDTSNGSALSCHSLCDSEDSLLTCGLGYMK